MSIIELRMMTHPTRKSIQKRCCISDRLWSSHSQSVIKLILSVFENKESKFLEFSASAWSISWNISRCTTKCVRNVLWCVPHGSTGSLLIHWNKRTSAKRRWSWRRYTKTARISCEVFDNNSYVHLHKRGLISR